MHHVVFLPGGSRQGQSTRCWGQGCLCYPQQLPSGSQGTRNRLRSGEHNGVDTTTIRANRVAFTSVMIQHFTQGFFTWIRLLCKSNDMVIIHFVILWRQQRHTEPTGGTCWRHPDWVETSSRPHHVDGPMMKLDEQQNCGPVFSGFKRVEVLTQISYMLCGCSFLRVGLEKSQRNTFLSIFVLFTMDRGALTSWYHCSRALMGHTCHYFQWISPALPQSKVFLGWPLDH